jgi:hypothetical protein
MTKSGRYETTTQRVETEFGSIYIHIDHLANGIPDGGWISWGSKDPESKIVGLISALSDGLNKALKNG